MVTLGEYFEAEARDQLAELDRRMHRMPVPDTAALHRAVRALRGAARIAREDRIHRAAAIFEAALKAVSAGSLAWTDDIAGRARATIDDLNALLERGGGEDHLESRVDQTIQRWSSIGVQLPPAGNRERVAGETASAAREFREFAAREVASIAEALDAALEQLAESPMDREPLRTILLRQRALLGAARLDELPVVAEILRAVEDLTAVIGRLDIAVKREWLDVFRIARDGLRSAVPPLQGEQDPPMTHSLSRLRHMREELLYRYGPGESGAGRDAATAPPPSPFEFATRPAAAPTALQAAAPAEAPAAVPAATPAHDAGAEPIFELVTESSGAEPVLELGDDSIVEAGPEHAQSMAQDAAVSPEDDVVSVEDLLYSRDAALRRALELRKAIVDADRLDPRTREAASEVFDLIRLALE